MHKPERSFCVYCKPEEINDATFRYLDVMRQGLRAAGLRDLGVTQDMTTLRSSEVVISISCLPAMRARLYHPTGRLVHWFQGIEAVERRFLHKGWRGLGRYLLWSIMESHLLRHARLKLFVSEEMRQFLGDQDRESSRSLVMPCYNVDFSQDAWNRAERYGALDVVYAGSLYPWQCVEDSLAAFRLVQQRRPDARLTLFTREIEKARALCSAHALRDVHIESVSPEVLLESLKRFSYGFILRDVMPINEVSTPTKFSSYLGAGVIPIMTQATPALARMAMDSPFKIVANSPKSHAQIADSLLTMAAQPPSVDAVRQSYNAIFDKYFDDGANAARIAHRARGI